MSSTQDELVFGGERPKRRTGGTILNVGTKWRMRLCDS
jgi:hypothetical protein